MIVLRLVMMFNIKSSYEHQWSWKLDNVPMNIMIWLVIWNHGILNDFPQWHVIIPTDELTYTFQRGGEKAPTSSWWYQWYPIILSRYDVTYIPWYQWYPTYPNQPLYYPYNQMMFHQPEDVKHGFVPSRRRRSPWTALDRWSKLRCGTTSLGWHPQSHDTHGLYYPCSHDKVS